MLLVELIMLIINLEQQHGVVQMHERIYLFFIYTKELVLYVFLSAANPQRPQQIADRHQIDDMEANTARTEAPKNPVIVPRGGAAAASTVDELGPLPPGWQMSKNDNERAFFIDHINKRTTWVRENKNNRRFIFLR
jgi:hypothetical protein